MNRGGGGETAADRKICGCASEREREKGKESKCAASNLRGRETDRQTDGKMM